jgi:hypothetical protein
MEMFNSSLMMLAATIFFSLLLERVMELVLTLYDYFEIRRGWQQYWNKKAEELSHILNEQLQGNWVKDEVNKAVRDYVSTGFPGLDGVQVVSADKLRSTSIKLVSKLLAVIIGIIIACGMHIDLFALVEQLNDKVALLNKVSPESYHGYFSTQNIPGLVGEVVTGVAIGLGSGAVHKIIEALEKKRNSRTDNDNMTQGEA